MRRIPAVPLVSALAMGTAAFASTPSSSTPPKPATAKPAAAKPAAAPELSVVGQITAVDAAAKTIKVKSGNQEMTFATTDKTVISLGAAAGKWDDLKVGATVRVRYLNEGGKMVADKLILPKH